MTMLRMAAVLLALMLSGLPAKAQEPTDHKTQSERPAPHMLVIIGCRVDDLTGKPGRPPFNTDAGARDLEWHFVNAELECKREVVPLEDAVAAAYPAKPYVGASMLGDGGAAGTSQAPVTGALYAGPMDVNFGQWDTCDRVGMAYAPDWQKQNPGWAVMRVGCPVPIINTDPNGSEHIIDWKLPDCPMAIKCRFDASAV